MPQQVDLVTVLANTLTGLSWTGFTVVCALVVVAILWCVMPFAVFGVKARLDAIEQGNRAQTEALLNELRRLNEMVLRLPRTDNRGPGTDRPAAGPPAVNRGGLRRSG